MNKVKDLCPQCLGSKEVVSRRKGKFNARKCTYCELDDNGEPTGLITVIEDEDEGDYINI